MFKNYEIMHEYYIFRYFSITFVLYKIILHYNSFPLMFKKKSDTFKTAYVHNIMILLHELNTFVSIV